MRAITIDEIRNVKALSGLPVKLTIIEAESHEQAILVVPPLFRNKARVIKLTYFYPKKDGDEIFIKKTDQYIILPIPANFGNISG